MNIEAYLRQRKKLKDAPPHVILQEKRGPQLAEAEADYETTFKDWLRWEILGSRWQNDQHDTIILEVGTPLWYR